MCWSPTRCWPSSGGSGWCSDCSGSGAGERARSPLLPAATGGGRASSVTDVFADAAIAREDLEPAARPPTPPAQPKLRRDYVASSPQAARERQQRRSDGEFAACLDADALDVAALRRLAWNGIPNKRRRAQVWRCLLRCEASQRAERREHAAARRAAFHEAVAAALLDVPASERDPGDAQMLRQILVDAPRTCPGSPLFAHDRVQALVVNVLYVWAVRHSA